MVIVVLLWYRAILGVWLESNTPALRNQIELILKKKDLATQEECSRILILFSGEDGELKAG